MEVIRVKLNFDSCFSIDKVRSKGGIALLWNFNTHVRIQSYSQHHIDTIVQGSNLTWRFTGVYGIP